MLRKLVATIAVGLFMMVAGLGSYANATGHPTPTRIGLIKFGGVPPVGRLYKLVSKAPNPPLFTLPASSPAATGGTLTVAMTGGELTCDLQSGAWDGNRGWKELGNPAGSKGYKYMNKGAPGNDPCKIVILKEKIIKVLAKATGTLPAPVGYPPGNPDISTVLSLGTDDYSALWVASHYKEKTDKLIKAKNQPALCNDGFPPGDGTLSLTEVAEFTSGVEGVAVCPNGDVFTSQFHTQVIWRLPYGGGAPEEYVTLGGNLLPVGLTCDDQGRLFAARWPNGGGAGSCARIDYQGHGGIDMPSSVGGADLENPNGIAFVPGIGVYMTDSARGIIVRYDEDAPDDDSITLAADDAHLVGD